MAKIPTPKNEYSVFRPQNVSSDAGFDAYAKAFDTFANQAAQTAGNLEATASATALANSQVQINDAITNFKKQSTLDPEGSGEYLGQLKNAVEQIKGQTRVNNKDKSSLDLLSSTALNQSDLIAAKDQYQIAKTMQLHDLLTTTQVQLENYKSGAITDPKAAEVIEKNIADRITQGLKSGVLTAPQGYAIWKQLHNSVILHNNALNILKGGKATAFDVNENPDLADALLANDIPLPENETTTQHASISGSLKNLDQVKRVIASGGTPTLSDYSKLNSTNAQDLAYTYYLGAKKSDAALASGHSFYEFQSRYNSLKKRKGGLSIKEQGELSRAEFLNNQLDQDPLIAYGRNKQVRGSFNELSLQLNLLDPKKMSREEYAQRNTDAWNDHYRRIDAFYDSISFPKNKRKFYAEAKIAELNNKLFRPDSNATETAQGIQEIARTPQNLLPYLASSMDSVSKGAAVLTIGRTIGKASKGFIGDLIQTVRSMQPKSKEEKAALGKEIPLDKSFDTISRELANNSSWNDLKGYLSHFTAGPGVTQSDAILQLGANYLIYKAKQKGVTGINKEHEITTFLTNIKRAFNVQKVGRITADLNVIPVHNDAELQAAGHYALEQVRQKYKKQGKTDAQINEMDLIDPVSFITTHTGDLIAINSLGQRIMEPVIDKETNDILTNHPLYEVPMTSSYLTHAELEIKKLEKELEKKRSTVQKHFFPQLLF